MAARKILPAIKIIIALLDKFWLFFFYCNSQLPNVVTSAHNSTSFISWMYAFLAMRCFTLKFQFQFASFYWAIKNLIQLLLYVYNVYIFSLLLLFLFLISQPSKGQKCEERYARFTCVRYNAHSVCSDEC